VAKKVVSHVIPPDLLQDNMAAWDERAPAHARAEGYRVQAFLDDPAYISDVVRFDLPLLGDVTGLRGLHLQCHIGTDTLSLARLGADMTGLDFSAASLAEARRLAEATGASIEYVQADAYDAARVLGSGRFDFVFTGIGALCWLPDVRGWAKVVRDLLAPGGAIIASVPNVGHWSVIADLIEGRWDVSPVGIHCVTHLRFVTERGLRELFAAAGLRITRLEPAPLPCPPAWREAWLAAATAQGLQADPASWDSYAFKVQAVATADSPG